MENIREIIGENLQALRKQKGLTQLDIAERFNYSDKAVSKWEKGDTLPDIETLNDICNFYGVTLDYLTHQGNKKEKEKYVIEKGSILLNHILITILISLSFIMIATIYFVYSCLVGNMEPYWLAFIWAVAPTCLSVSYCNYRFFKSKITYFISNTVFIWSIIVGVFLQVWVNCNISVWPIFLLGAPLEAALIIWLMMVKKK